MNKWDLDACIHCGKCTRSCLFLEKYGIDLPVLKEKPELAYHCFLCGTCGCVCPKGIDGKEIALDSRRKFQSCVTNSLHRQETESRMTGKVFQRSHYPQSGF